MYIYQSIYPYGISLKFLASIKVSLPFSAPLIKDGEKEIRIHIVTLIILAIILPAWHSLE